MSAILVVAVNASSGIQFRSWIYISFDFHYTVIGCAENKVNEMIESVCLSLYI